MSLELEIYDVKEQLRTKIESVGFLLFFVLFCVTRNVKFISNKS